MMLNAKKTKKEGDAEQLSNVLNGRVNLALAKAIAMTVKTKAEKEADKTKIQPQQSGQDPTLS